MSSWATFRDNVEMSQNGFGLKKSLSYLRDYVTDRRLLQKKIDKERRRRSAQQIVLEKDNPAYTEKYGMVTGYIVSPAVKRLVQEGQPIQMVKEPSAYVRCDGCGVETMDNGGGLLSRPSGANFYLKNRRHGAVIVLCATTYNDVVRSYDMTEWEIKEPDKGLKEL